MFGGEGEVFGGEGEVFGAGPAYVPSKQLLLVW